MWASTWGRRGSVAEAISDEEDELVVVVRIGQGSQNIDEYIVEGSSRWK